MVDWAKVVGFLIGFFGTLVLFLVINSITLTQMTDSWCTSAPVTPYHDTSLVIPIGIVIGLVLMAIIYYYVFEADSNKNGEGACLHCKKPVICPHCGEEFTPKRWGREK